MNHAYVIDSNIAVKVIIQEEFSDRANTLFETCRNARRPLVAPPHLPSEVTNAVYQQLRRRSITEAEADRALSQFLRLPIQLVAPRELYPRALLFARNHSLTNIYDSLYVALAEMFSAELWTDDRALINSVGASAPWIRWIGNYPLAM